MSLSNKEVLNLSLQKMAVSEKTKGTILGALAGGTGGLGIGLGAGAVPALASAIDSYGKPDKQVDTSTILPSGAVGMLLGALMGGVAGRGTGAKQDRKIELAKQQLGIAPDQKLSGREKRELQRFVQMYS